jgi:hypothetical protein
MHSKEVCLIQEQLVGKDRNKNKLQNLLLKFKLKLDKNMSLNQIFKISKKIKCKKSKNQIIKSHK